MLQEAERREAGTKHLLLALTGSDVVRAVLDQFKLLTNELGRQVEREAPRGAASMEDDGEIGVSPRLKDALPRAFCEPPQDPFS